jgi:hypothetical protein
MNLNYYGSFLTLPRQQGGGVHGTESLTGRYMIHNLTVAGKNMTFYSVIKWGTGNAAGWYTRIAVF